MAIKRTGRLKLESQLAALIRCLRCSRLFLMSLRDRIPRMVGTKPTAVNGLIMGFHPDLRVWAQNTAPGPAERALNLTPQAGRPEIFYCSKNSNGMKAAIAAPARHIS